MPNKKARVFALLAAMVLLICAAFPAASAAYAPRYTEEADILSALGLFKGTSSGYELERTPTRTEALVLLIRLLGKDAEAQSFSGAGPFADVPEWAGRYVAWAYEKGLTKGMSDTLFGGNAPAGARMFVTFVLRALGYNDAAGDFGYETALDKGTELGLCGAGAYRDDADGFYRDDCVHLCFTALTARLKDGGGTLISKLAGAGAVKKETALRYGLIPEKTSYTVAVVGDSFTAGYGLEHPETEAFPAVLSAVTGTYSFKTENYGVAGVAVNNESILSYLGSKTGARSFKTKADVILIVLGANDAVWTPDMNDFSEDYEQILKTYVNMPHAPKVIVLTPPRLFGLQGYDGLMDEIVAEEMAAARKMSLDVIDIYAFSKDKEDYCDDSVHFNAEGHRLVAEFIYDELSAILSDQAISNGG